MSTNYYVKLLWCPHCERSEETHLGKTTFKTFISNYDEYELNTFINAAYKIYDEYDKEYTKEEMLSIIIKNNLQIIEENFC